MFGKPDTIYQNFKFFAEKVTALELKDFCEAKGFYIHIYDNGYIELRRDLNGSKQVL